MLMQVELWLALCTNFRNLSHPPVVSIRRKGPEDEGLTQVSGSQEWGCRLTPTCVLTPGLVPARRGFSRVCQ